MSVILISSSLLSRHILQISDSISDMGSVSWQIVLCLVLAWIIVYLCLFKGVASSGKVSHDHLSVLQFSYSSIIREFEFWNPGNGCLWKPDPCNFGLESAIKLIEEIRQTIKEWKPESSTRNLQSTAWNRES